MDDININSSSGTSSIPSSEVDNFTPTPSNTTSLQTDTLSAAAAAESNPNSVFFKLAKPIYILVWSKFIDVPVQRAKEQILSDQTFDINLLKGMRANSILTGEFLASLQATYDDIANKMEALYDLQKESQEAAKTAVDTYNDELDDQKDTDKDKIKAMNDATTAYNASDKDEAATTTYNNAIDAYTLYRDTTRVNTYNDAKSTLDSAFATYQTEVDSQNEKINEINALRASVGIPPMPLDAAPPSIPAQTTIPAPPTVATHTAIGNAPNVTHVSAIPVPVSPPSSEDLIDQYAGAFIDSLIPQLSSVNTFLDQLTEYRDYQRYYLGPRAGKISTLPNSYVDATNKVFIDQSISVGSGAGGSLSSMIAGLSDINLNRVLSNAIASDAALKANVPLSPRLLDELRLINITLLSRAALGSSIPAFSLLSERLAYMDENSSAVQIALGLAFAIQIAALGSTQDQQETILNRLKAENPNADLAQLTELAESLTAASNLSLGLFALSQLAQALNLPDLPAQLLNQIDTPATANVLTSASTTTFTDVLNNPLSVSYLKADLSKALVESGNIDQDTANNIAKSIVLNDISDEAQLKDAINKQLINSGVAASQTTALATRAAEFLKAEINSANILDTAIQKDIVQKDYLTRELQSQGVSAEITAKVVPNITSNSYTSRRELRDGITGSLVDSGIPLSEARFIATNAVRFNQSGTLNPEALSDTQLAENLTSQVTNATGAELGTAQSQQLAGLLVDVLFRNDETRPLSITNIIRTNIERLDNIEDVHLAEATHAFLKPTFDLYHFNQRIMDPANTFVLSMWTGVMYSSKFKHTESIDIIV